MPTPTDRDELRTQIAELEDAGRYTEAAVLKTKATRPAPAEANPVAEAEKKSLRDQIAAHEAEGRFGSAAPLKTKLQRLVTGA